MDADVRARNMAASAVSVVCADADDIAQIMRLERRPGYPPLVGTYDAVEHRRRMALPGCTYLLGRSGREIVGFAVIRRDDDGMGTAQLHRLAVWPPGQGHGGKFMRAICQWVFAEPGIDRLWLDLLPSNAPAARLYRKMGFVSEGVMRAALRVPTGRQDLALMSLLRQDWQSRISG